MQEVAGCGRLSDCEELVVVLTGGNGPRKSIYFLIHHPHNKLFHFEKIYIISYFLGYL